MKMKKKKKRTGCICEPESDGLVLDVTHVADRHLAGVIGQILGSEIFQLQHLGLTLDENKHSSTMSLCDSEQINFCHHSGKKKKSIWIILKKMVLNVMKYEELERLRLFLL